MHDVADFLKEHPPFRDLDAATLDRLAEHAEVEYFTAGTTIFEQGAQPQGELRVIRRGAVELVDHGRVLDMLGEGDLFGHPSMVSGLPPGFEARAHEDSLCYSLAAEDVLPLLARPAGLRYLARSLLDRPKPGPVVAADASGFDLAQQPVRAMIREQPIVCEPSISLRHAARRMADSGASSVLVRLDGGQLGIVTDQDLRRRVVADGLSVDSAISQVMTTPVVTIGPERNGADVLMVMLDHGIRHLPVIAPGGEVLGVISDIDLLAAETRTPFVLRSAIAGARDVEELRRAAARLNPALIGLHEAGLASGQISSLVSVVADALIRRTIELVTAALGPPPVEFAWLSLGSHGRREAVPSSDIDSGIVWADDGGSEREYARMLADEVLETLKTTGWRSDSHGVTASGSMAARSATDWRRTIGDWLDKPGQENVIMALSIVLDNRSVYGPPDAFGALAGLRAVRDRPRVLSLLLRLALADKPPTGFLRDFVVEHSGEHRGTFDIKRGGLVPIVDIARYGGHAAGVVVTSTTARLQAASGEGTLSETDAGTLEEAYELFAALRLEHQVTQLREGVTPDNHLDPKALSSLTRHHLRDAFRAVASVQKGLAQKLLWGT
jgi:CBS domain-containing protein